MTPRRFLPFVLAAVLTGPWLATAQSDQETAAAAERLLQRARDLRAEGRLDESAELTRKAKQLQDQGPLQDEERPALPRRPDALPDELSRRDGEVRAQPRDLESFWRPELRRPVQEPERRDAIRRGPAEPERREALRRAPEAGPRPELDRESLDSLQPPAGAPARPGAELRPVELRERLQHLQQAIRHLQAAGSHDVARRVEQQAGQLRRQLQSPRAERPGGMPMAQPAVPGALLGLREEVAALRNRVRELERAVEETRQLLRRRGEPESEREDRERY